MTILEAIKMVLRDSNREMCTEEIYQEILKQGLYVFGAKDPKNVVNGNIRRHCIGLEFPTAHPVKYFEIIRRERKKTYYSLLSQSSQKGFQKERQTNVQSNEMLPEEQIMKAYQKHIESIKEALLENILSQDSSFFEHLVVEMFLKMGYGYDENSGVVVGGPYDEGIDGIIIRDKLGLDKIYIQAKRWKRTKSVEVKDVREFIGAMKEVQKGILITTSYFSKKAKERAKDEPIKTVRLIDGDQLIKFLLEYELGVEAQTALNIYRIDEGYFQD